MNRKVILVALMISCILFGMLINAQGVDKYIVNQLTEDKDTISINKTHLKSEIEDKTNLDFLYLSDETYHIYDFKSTKMTLLSNNYNIYQKEVYDCDDMTRSAISQTKEILPGMVIGYGSGKYINGSRHAVPIFMDKTLNLWVHEPKSVTFKRLEESGFVMDRLFL